jgi:hypothetical protein
LAFSNPLLTMSVEFGSDMEHADQSFNIHSDPGVTVAGTGISPSRLEHVMRVLEQRAPALGFPESFWAHHLRPRKSNEAVVYSCGLGDQP